MPPSSYRIGVDGSYRWAAARATQAGPILLVPKSFGRPGYLIRRTDRARRAVHRAARTRRESAAQENPLRPARIPCLSKRSLPPTYPSLHERPRCAPTWHCSRSTPPVGWARAGGARGLSATTRTSSRSFAWRACARTSARRWTEPSGSSQRVTIVEQPIVGDKGIDTAFYVSGWQVHPAHRSSGLGRRMHDVLQCGGARLANTATAHQSRIFFTDIPASGLRLRGHGAFYIQLRRWADDGHGRIGIFRPRHTGGSGFRIGARRRAARLDRPNAAIRASARDVACPSARSGRGTEHRHRAHFDHGGTRRRDGGRRHCCRERATSNAEAERGALLLVALGEHGRHYKRRVHLARAGAMSITSPPRLSMHKRPWTRMRAACRGRVVRTHPAASIVRAKSTER